MAGRSSVRTIARLGPAVGESGCDIAGGQMRQIIGFIGYFPKKTVRFWYKIRIKFESFPYTADFDENVRSITNRYDRAMSSSGLSDLDAESPEVVLRRPQQRPSPLPARASPLRSSEEAQTRARRPQLAGSTPSAFAQVHDGQPVAVSASSTLLHRLDSGCVSPSRSTSNAPASPSSFGSPEIVLMHPAAGTP